MKKIKIISIIYLISIFFSKNSFAIGNELEKGKDNTNMILSFFSTEMLLNVFFAGIVIIFTVILSRVVSSKLSTYLENNYSGEEKGREELIAVLSRTINISILSIGIAITLTLLGVDMGIFLGGFGFGLGFTLKIFLTNFIAGILMVTQGFYHIGDLVEVGGKKGRIIQIHALFTSIEQFDGVVYYVPNVKFLEEEVSNFHSNDKRRIEVPVVVDYNTDITKAKQILMQVVGNFPNILQAPETDIIINEMGNNGVQLTLRFWINSTDEYFISKSNVTETVNLAFKQAGIIIPFSQITLSNRSDFIIKK